MQYLDFACNDCVDREIYFLSRDCGYVFKYDIEENRIIFIDCIKKEGELYIKSQRVGSDIYYFPYVGEKIWKYDTLSERFSSQPFNVDSMTDIKGCSVCKALDDEIIVLNGKGIFRYDFRNGALGYYDEWFKECQAKYGEDIYSNTYDNICIVEDRLWIPLGKEDRLLEFSLSDNEYKIWDLPNEGIKYNTLVYSDGTLWLSGDKPYLINWEIGSSYVKKIDCFPKGFKLREINIPWSGVFFSSVICDKEKIYLAPLRGNMFIEFDIRTERMKQLDESLGDDEFCFYFHESQNVIVYQKNIWVDNQHKMTKSAAIQGGIITDLSISMDNIEIGTGKNKLNKNRIMKEEFPGMLRWWIDSVID